MRLAPYYFIILIFNSLKGREGMKTFGDFQKNGNLPCPPPRSKPKIKKIPFWQESEKTGSFYPFP